MRKKQQNAGVEQFLDDYRIKGITPSVGKKLYSAFGDRALEAILTSEPGAKAILGSKFDEAWDDLYDKQKGFDLMLWLSQKGLSGSLVNRVWSWLKTDSPIKPSEALVLWKQDPYRISMVNGVGFAKADWFAVKGCGLEAKGEERKFAVAREALSKACEQTGGGCSKEDMVRQINWLSKSNGFLTESESRAFASQVYDLSLEKKIAIEAVDEKGKNCFYSLEFFQAEEAIAEILLRRSKDTDFNNVYELAEGSFDEAVSATQEENGLTLHDEQYEALKTMCSAKFSLIFGKPGAGKTTLLKIAAPVLEKGGRKVFYAAPTGKAAKRMSKSLGRQAMTIHRLLGVGVGGDDGGKAGKGAAVLSPRMQLRDADALVIDESSMLDAKLFLRLLKALGPKTQLILVGDPEQLPSVDAGKVFRDLIDSGAVTTSVLNTIRRQSAESKIIEVARALADGKVIDFDDRNSDCVFLGSDEDETIGERISNIITKNVSSVYDIRKQVQVLCGGKDGPAGTESLNRILQEKLNPKRAGVRECAIEEGFIVREGDKVMQLSNDYERVLLGHDGKARTGVFNGDSGIVKRIEGYAGSETVEIEFEDGTAIFKRSEIKRNIGLAWACTVHKFQGSESSVIFFVGTERSTKYPLRTRNLLYTALTRAKNKCVVVGEKKILFDCAKNDAIARRNTRLKGLLNGSLCILNPKNDEVRALSEERALEKLLKDAFDAVQSAGQEQPELPAAASKPGRRKKSAL